MSPMTPEAKLLYDYFCGLAAIPHGSGNTKGISDHCVSFAKSLGLTVIQDAYNNVIIQKPATPGYEDHPTVILQGHLDMVCEKDPEVEFDFTADSLKLRLDGDWLFAEGTTLGGDNGIAIAMIMAILADNNIPHPALEALFTTDEETGMDGAMGLDPAALSGRLLLNLDSEAEGIFTVSCAGGARCDLSLPMEAAPAAGETAYTITLSGLAGGHSGVEIHQGRMNAARTICLFLGSLPGNPRIVSLSGGNKDNAIPSHAVAVILTETDPSPFAEDFIARYRLETDPGLTLSVTPAQSAPAALTAADSQKLCTLITTLPDGVVAMSRDIPGLVQTSLNLGILRVTETGLSAVISVRSSVTDEKLQLIDRIAAIAGDFGASVDSRNHYPAWEYKKDSLLRDTMARVYTDLTGKTPVIEAIHAGLECGLFAEKLPGLDAVSIGPEMYDIHTPRERLSISSSVRTYEFVKAVLAAL
ncbi:MAG: aminoacyl-histidine dipeptidase [Clostridia bacterium]|nr:aminoacyl-histidine dipeptidase [Clostridia bacterium]